MLFEFPQLKSLKIIADGGQWDEDSYGDSQRFLELFRLMNLPSLVNIDLHLRSVSQETVTDILGSLIYRNGHPDEGGGLTTLCNFTLRTQETTLELQSINDLRADLLEYMPNVEHVFIEGPGALYLGDGSTSPFTWSTDHDNSDVPYPFPHLRSITFKHCFRVERLFLQAFAQDLVRHWDVGPFKMLKLIECPLVTSPLVVELLREHCDVGETIIFQTKVSSIIAAKPIRAVTFS